MKERLAKFILPTPITFPHGLVKEKIGNDKKYKNLARGLLTAGSATEAIGILFIATHNSQLTGIILGAMTYIIGKGFNLTTEYHIKHDFKALF